MYQNHNGIFRRMGCALMALAVAGAAAACSRQEQNDPTPSTSPSQPQQIQQTTEPAQEVALAVESITEQGDQILVTTSWCTLRYPFAFADLIRVTAAEVRGVPVLCFTADIDGEEYPVFDLCFGRGDIPLGELELPNGQGTVSVYADMHRAGSDLTDSQRSTFLAVQECFNDVSASLSEAPGFTPAD